MIQMKKSSIKKAALAGMLAAAVCVAGCQVEKYPSREQQQEDAKKNIAPAASTAAVTLPVPSTDDAALVISACGPAASDQVVTVNDKMETGTVRRMVYRGRRDTTLDFISVQVNKANTVWRFNEAIVENVKLLTAENIKVYLPCAATALAKEF